MNERVGIGERTHFTLMTVATRLSTTARLLLTTLRSYSPIIYSKTIRYVSIFPTFIDCFSKSFMLRLNFQLDFLGFATILFAFLPV